MAFQIKTTLQFDDTVMTQLKREAARQRKTKSELDETALRNLFRAKRQPEKLPRLPVFRGGPPNVDLANRKALYELLNGSRNRC